YVSFFAVLREVEALAFVLGGDAQADEGIDQLEQEERADDGQDPGHQHAERLVEQLAGVAFEQAAWKRVAVCVFENWVHSAGGKNTSEQRAQRAARAVHTEGVERIVV